MPFGASGLLISSSTCVILAILILQINAGHWGMILSFPSCGEGGLVVDLSFEAFFITDYSNTSHVPSFIVLPLKLIIVHISVF